MKSREMIREERVNRAEETLKDHKYRCLINTNGVEVWRCAEPGTSMYAFDIMMTRFGIAVVGDIDNLTWTVGNSYGMEFLAGKDVTYYIHTKLDQVHKKEEFDEPKFRQAIVNGICSTIVDRTDDDAYEDLPPYIKQGANDELLNGSCFDSLKSYVVTYDISLYNLMCEAEGINFVEEAQLFMRDNCDELGLGSDWYEIRISKDSESLIDELYLINHAAKKIMAIKVEQVVAT